MKYFVLSMAIIAAFGACRAADDSKYTISLYDDVRDHTEAFTVIANNFKKLCTHTDGQPINPMEQKHFDKTHAMLRNNTNGSPLIKPIDPTKFFRIALHNQRKLIGVADFFENGIECDAIKKHDGYSETLLTDEEHTAQYPLLIAAMLKKSEEIGIKRFIHHLVNNGMQGWPEYKALIAAGFTEQQQTDFEKKYNIVRFEKNLQD